MTNAIEVDNLSVFFKDTHVFDSFSLSVLVGDKVTIAGASGSGKSTLLRCIMGFTPLTSGTIRIMGDVLTAATVWQLRGKMAYVAQEPELGNGIVREALQRPFVYKANHNLSFDEREALRLFDAFMLYASLMNKDIGTLSGGEKQRIALVASLMFQRPVLLLDEAASALDSASKQAVREYLCERSDLTILSVSHDIRDFSLSDNIVDISRTRQEATP